MQALKLAYVAAFFALTVLPVLQWTMRHKLPDGTRYFVYQFLQPYSDFTIGQDVPTIPEAADATRRPGGE